MSLIISISGIRGTIGPGENNLNPVNLIRFIASFIEVLREKNQKNIKIIIGRDGRCSGHVFLNLAISTLLSMGVDVVNLDLATTPTVELAVIKKRADGGIIISASHNPENWNGLKFLNNKGEFLNKKDGKKFLQTTNKQDYSFVEAQKFGTIKNDFNYLEKHIDEILKISLIKKSQIVKNNFKIVVDGINSVGAIAVPRLLKKIGVKNIIVINSKIIGKFNHNPEPIDKNLTQLRHAVLNNKADLGVAVDPDVDRLAIVDEKGDPIGEEYTLISVADYIFKNFSIFKNKYKKVSVSNLSSSMAMVDISKRYGGDHKFSAVGELNVVDKMKKTKAVIGGEGNGGIIFPDLHYGRDALIGIALLLSYLATEKIKFSEIRKKLPNYFILKNKIELSSNINIKKIFINIEKKYSNFKIIKIDGLKIIFHDNSWFHLRQSNTEPIIRIYCEAQTKNQANKIFKQIIKDIKINFI